MEKILIIEDDRSLQKPLKHVFEAEGYTLAFAVDGAAGIDAFRSAIPALVVLDLTLPKIHGREVCRVLKKESPTLPIIVLSASADEVDKVLLLELERTTTSQSPLAPKNCSHESERSYDAPMAQRWPTSTRSTTYRWILPRWN